MSHESKALIDPTLQLLNIPMNIPNLIIMRFREITYANYNMGFKKTGLDNKRTCNVFFRSKSLLISTHCISVTINYIYLKKHTYMIIVTITTHTKIQNDLVILECFRDNLNSLSISVF